LTVGHAQLFLVTSFEYVDYVVADPQLGGNLVRKVVPFRGNLRNWPTSWQIPL
jgi:hypothetical protein